MPEIKPRQPRQILQTRIIKEIKKLATPEKPIFRVKFKDGSEAFTFDERIMDTEFVESHPIILWGSSQGGKLDGQRNQNSH